MKPTEDGIGLFLDNTTVHRVGHVLDQKPGAILRPADGLALFHLAEHIMFSRSMVISNFEALSTFETTSRIVTELSNGGYTEASEGRLLASIVPFTEESYDDACAKAAWRVLDELSACDAETLTDLGRDADETTRPRNIAPPSLDDWLAIEASPDHLVDQIHELRAKRAEGSFALMLLRCEPLRTRIMSLRAKNRRARERQAAALSTLMRVHINEELAKKQESVYSPAPQRARIAGGANNLFRHRLEMVIQSIAKSEHDAPASRTLQIMVDIDRLPLPLFAFHELQTADTDSPQAFLEAARVARDRLEVAYIRSWLTRWERAYSSDDLAERTSALNELERRKRELADYLSGRQAGLASSLHLGGTFELDPMTGTPKWSPSLPDFRVIGDVVARRYSKKRIYWAALANDLVADKALGAHILEQVGFGVAEQCDWRARLTTTCSGRRYAPRLMLSVMPPAQVTV